MNNSKKVKIANDKKEIASLIQTIVEDIVESKCELYFSKKDKMFLEFKAELDALSNRVQEQDVSTRKRIGHLEDEISNTRAQFYQSGMGNDYTGRLDSIEVQLSTLAMERSKDTQESTRRIKQSLKQVESNVEELENEIKRIEDSFGHMSRSLHEKLYVQSESIEVLESSLKGMCRKKPEFKSTDFMLDEMTERMTILEQSITSNATFAPESFLHEMVPVDHMSARLDAGLSHFYFKFFLIFVSREKTQKVYSSHSRFEYFQNGLR